MATIYDIAKKVGVSTATVSRALNGHDDVKRETKEKIQKVAKEMGYQINQIARSLSMRKSWNIGLLFSDDLNSGLKHTFFANIIDQIMKTASSHGYDVTFVSNNFGGSEMSYLEHCRHRMFDGVIVANVESERALIQELLDSDIPITAIDMDTPKATCVNSKNRSGIRQAVEHLVSKGYKDIAYITGQENNYVSDDRLQSFYATAEDLGIRDSVRHVVGTFTDAEKSYNLTKELLESNNPPRAILYSDDLAACGGHKYVVEKGYKMPEQVALCGYDGLDISQQLTPRMTTIKQNTVRIGEVCTTELIKKIESDDYENKVFWIDVALLEGDTT